MDTVLKQTCSHCGDHCPDDSINIDHHSYFCCNGCKMVYQLLHDNELQDYYTFTQTPGISPDGSTTDFDYLDDENLVQELLDFNDDGLRKVTLHLPQIHCSSCLYLLEHLSQLDHGVIQSKVNFTTKKASILYREEQTNLKKIIVLLTRIGYEPRLHLDSLDQDNSPRDDKQLLYKLGLAGFSFGNIMLLSFPEYLGFDKASYLFHIGYINILLATPLLFYSGWGYLKSAWQGLKVRHLNIDLPIALGMITLYGRSLYEILSHSGEGYLDSFAGFIFFLLIGKWFQSFTYQVLDFERNYKSYFPIYTLIKKDNGWVSQSLGALQAGDLILVKNEQLIPADGIITKGKARIDYSFVTGESELISKDIGDMAYAGGRHKGSSIELTLTKKVDQSYLTQLWNEDTFKKESTSDTSKLISYISTYFTVAVLSIALLTLLVWSQIDSGRMFQVFTAVLIVACPCALALSIPFTYGNIVRLLSQHGLYLKNTTTIEHMQDISHIVFDKTGTITDNTKVRLTFKGSEELSHDQKAYIRSVCHHSSHPLSRSICDHFTDATLLDIDQYQERIGLGIAGICNGHTIRVGSSDYIFGTDHIENEKGVFVEIDGVYLGHFRFDHALREGIQSIIHGLKKKYTLSVLSGDNDAEHKRMADLFGEDTNIHFNQTPKDKLDKINELQKAGNKVMMIGDGLNDAGALKQSNVGIVISDKVNNFSPACDAILEGSRLPHLFTQLSYLNTSRWIIYGAFAMAFAYNTIGLGFAITGNLSPVVAAILMPLSSISVIVYGVVSSLLYYRWKFAKSRS